MNMLQKLDFLMSKKGVNKSQLAAQSGIPKTTIYGWYTKGYEGMRQPTLQILANFFDVTMEYLTNDSIEFEQKEKPATTEGNGLSQKQNEVYSAIADLGEEERKDILKYIDFVKSKRNQ